jgi:hypothetical protein
VLTKVYKDYTPPFGGDYVWFIQHFGLSGSDGVIPAAKKAIPRQYWFINKKNTTIQSLASQPLVSRISFPLTRFPIWTET